MQATRRATLAALLLLAASTARADLPVHCLHMQVRCACVVAWAGGAC